MKDFFKKIFSCNSEDKSERKKAYSRKSSCTQFPVIQKIASKEIAYNINCVMENVRYTSSIDKAYFVPKDWFDQLISFLYHPSNTSKPLGIVNRRSENINMVALIYELMKEIILYFPVDSIIYGKFSFSKEDIDKYRNEEVIQVNRELLFHQSVSDFVELKVKKVPRFEEDPSERIESTFCYVKIINRYEKYNKTNYDNNEENLKIVSKKEKEKEKKREDRIIPENSSNEAVEDINIMNQINVKKDRDKSEDRNSNSYLEKSQISRVKDTPTQNIKSHKNDNIEKINSKSFALNSTTYTKVSSVIIFSNLNKLSLKPKGLYNPSVYCFMNTCLQCLTSIPELNAYFYKKEYTNCAKTSNLVTCKAYSEFIEYYKDSKSSFRAPSSIYKVCHSVLQANRQHDCHEFLFRFLDKIMDEINGKIKYSLDNVKLAQEAWKIYKEKNISIIDSTFSGLMKSSVICHKCKHISGKFSI